MAILGGRPKAQFFKPGTNEPLSGGLVFTYDGGTTTKKTTYKNSAESLSNTNPIILDANGECELFYGTGSYTVVVAPADDTDPPTNPIWTSARFTPNNTTLSSIIAADGTILSDSTGTFTGTVTVSGTSSASGKLILNEKTSSGGGSISIQAPADVSTSYNIILPTSFTTGEYLQVASIAASDVTLSTAAVVVPPASATMLNNYIDGCLIANGTDATNDINIGAGKCTTSDNTTYIINSGTIVKQLDAAWAEGSAAGGRPTGVALADGWYYVFLLLKNDGTTVDAGFDTSITATNLLTDATDYTKYRRVGCIFRSGGIWPFTAAANGNIIWDVSTSEGISTNQTGVSKTLDYVPPLPFCTARISVAVDSYTSGTSSIRVFNQTSGEVAASTAVYYRYNALGELTGDVTTINGKIRYTSGSGTYSGAVYVHSFIDPRGKDGTT